ncbi:non-canonical purine NTP diphosphatase [Flavobacteriaceae bacterium TK19130]|nr:non-canonical purine NTP diphosphatase [Thermobacterium salinum]
MKLVFATHNKNKLKEVRALMPSHIELLSLEDIDCHDDIAETAETIEGNAAIKANFVRDHYGYNCFADDTGLEISALNGEPGVYSARYAGEEKSAEANMKKVLEKLADTEDRSARFKTVFALTINEVDTLFEGICDGKITKEPRGEEGFGYDPIFQPKGSDKTFAEMTLAEKGKIGHRGKALRYLVEYLKDSER